MAKLQGDQVNIMAALAQNEQQIADLQGRIDAFAAEQALIGNQLAEAAVADSNVLDQTAAEPGQEPEAAELSVRERLQTRLVELDQVVEQSRQELQGALVVHAQYTADRERIEADIQALGEATSEETAQILTDLQASQVQICRAATE